MRGLTILGLVCTMSACSIRAVTFSSPDAADTAGRGGQTGADGGKDTAAVDAARDVALEIAADVAAEGRGDTAPDTARDVAVEAPVDQAGSDSEAAVDSAGDAGTNDASDASDDSSVPVCGNGIREDNEECDEGMDDTPTCNGSMAGSLGCRSPRCGDEHVNLMAGEECDTGIAGDTATCNGPFAGVVACKISRCGDGHLNELAPETCDDGNTSSCGTCSADCTTVQPGFDCPADTPCVGRADCESADCTTLNVCAQAP
jgi:cysteine-rich repeat protein